jgi:hypothetical protein
MEDQKSNICSIIWQGILALLWGLMKRYFPFASLLLLISMILLSCHKDNREELFVIGHSVDFNIQPGLNTFDTHIYDIGNIPSQLDQRLDDTGYTIDQVASIEPKRAYLSSVFEDVNLDFIHQVSVLIYDIDNPVNRIEFCYLDPVPFKKKFGIELFPGIADVSDWLKNEYFGIEIRLNYRDITPSLIQMRLEFDYRALGP